MNSLTSNLVEARAFLVENFDKGAPCPLCKQFVKRYRRKLNSSMARALIAIYHYHRANGPAAFDVATYLRTPHLKLAQSQGDWAKLQYWGLIVQKPGLRSDGSWRNGMWSITERGERFARGEIRVPKHIYMYNGDALASSHDDKTTSIQEALGEKFNYAELMQ